MSTGKRFLRTLPALALLAVLGCGLASAQNPWKKKKDDDTTRNVLGVVTSAAGDSIKGAVVQLKDTKTLQVRSFFTQTDGKYHFAGLNNNIDYEVKATYEGASSPTKRVSVYDSRKDVILDLKLDK